MTNDELRQIQGQFIEQKKRREQQYAREQDDLKQRQDAREQEAMREQFKLSSPALKFNSKGSGNSSSAYDQSYLSNTELRQQMRAHPYARQPRSFSSLTTVTSNKNLLFKLADLRDLEQSKLKEGSGYKYNALRSASNSKSSTGYMSQPPLHLQFPMPEPEEFSNHAAFTNVPCSLQSNQGMVYTGANGYASPERISEPLVSEYNAYSIATDIRSLLVSSNDTDNGSSKNITIQPDVFNKLVDEVMNTMKQMRMWPIRVLITDIWWGCVYYQSGIDALLAATRTL
ncbi:hypothetical protein BX661DRAFT_186587 [Kickxella alabastrina]|uniref:uncharacterized protein n=1 Tax=Kickxella alabastrina TaxID=61397 RepID=UPI0022207CFC|nr:uncharacterized protein BX661DRAFT_186587 [Kickxella alabastrina]KAI7823431.1 hypothetical protein BX661DRAFT_186587 [Kickxella alabastrina]